MGLKCSLLGHSYEAAGVERERERQGSEVVTVSRELERCTRCDAERVVSESTEVTAVVDADGVDADGGAGGDYRTGAESGRAGGTADGQSAAERAAAAVDDVAEGPDDLDLEERDPEEEDAEILTDDEPEREPGQWPEETEGAADDDGPVAGTVVDPGDDATDRPSSGGDVGGESTGGSTDGARDADPDPDDAGPDEESLAGITVPDEVIVCPECSFSVEAESGYREGDPCPKCGAWLESERNP